MHPLAHLVTEAIDGRFPASDGGWSRVPLWRPGVEGVVAMTGHAFLAVGDDVADADLCRIGVNGLGGATAARTTVALAGNGDIGCLDVLLARRASAPGETAPLASRPDLIDHPRVRFAARLRDDIRVLGRPRGDDAVVAVARGVGGLTEIGVELRTPGVGQGVEAVQGALATLEEHTPVIANCSAGNARAVRTFLAAGFAPIGETQLWCPERDSSERRPASSMAV